MKKFLITIIVLLIILAIGQGIYYNFRKSNISPNTITVEQQNKEKSNFRLNGLDEIYDKYNPKISKDELNNKIYDLIYKNFSQIHDDTEKKSNEQIIKFYQENKDKIDAMNIYNEDEFFMIAKQMQNTFYDELIMQEYKIDEDSITEKSDIILFDLTFKYDNDSEIIIGVKLSKRIEEVEFYSASKLDKVFEKYIGNVSKKELLDKISLFVSNVIAIRQNTSFRSENEKLQFFDLNKDGLKDIGIITPEDFINIASSVNWLNWRYDDLYYERYEVDDETYIEEEYYNSFEMILHYNHYGKINLKVSMSKSSNVDPSIKLSIYEDESE